METKVTNAREQMTNAEMVELYNNCMSHQICNWCKFFDKEKMSCGYDRLKVSEIMPRFERLLGENERLIESMDKYLTPKPVIRTADDGAWWVGYCPCCGKLVQYNYEGGYKAGERSQYCYHCGQLCDFDDNA